MITSIIQILAIALLFYALYRETKRDRLNELRKREELQDLFREQEKTFHTNLGSVTSSIKAQIELTYSERFDSILKRLEYFGELIEVYVTHDAISKEEVDRLQTSVSNSNAMASQILGQIPSIESIESIQSTTDSIHSELSSLIPLIQDLITARTENLIKDGEANRTLRRRLQESALTLNSVKANLRDKEALVIDLKDQIQKLSSLESQLASLEKDKAYHEAAADLLAEELTHFQDQTRAQLASLHMPAEEIERIFSSISQNVQKLMNPTAHLDAACQ